MSLRKALLITGTALLVRVDAFGGRGSDGRGPNCQLVEREFKAAIGQPKHPGDLAIFRTQELPASEAGESWLVSCILLSTATLGMNGTPEFIATYLFRGALPPLRIGPALETLMDRFGQVPEARFPYGGTCCVPTRAFVSPSNDAWIVQETVQNGTFTYRAIVLDRGVPVEKAIFRTGRDGPKRVAYDFLLDSGGRFQVRELHGEMRRVHPRKKDGTSMRGFDIKDERIVTLIWNGRQFEKLGEAVDAGAVGIWGDPSATVDGKVYFSTTSLAEFTWFYDQRVRILDVVPTVSNGDMVRVDVAGEIQGFVDLDSIKIVYPERPTGD